MYEAPSAPCRCEAFNGIELHSLEQLAREVDSCT